MSDEIKTLDEFYLQMAETGLRLQHQFQVVFYPPTEVSWPATLDKNISLYAEGVNVPGRAQNKQTIKYLGYPFQFPTDMQVSELINMTVRCDGGVLGTGSLLRNAMFDWANSISNIPREDGLTLGTGGGRKRLPTSTTKVEVKLLDETLTKIMETYTLHGAFPTSVGDMNMAAEAGAPATFELVFSYQYFTVKSTV